MLFHFLKYKIFQQDNLQTQDTKSADISLTSSAKEAIDILGPELYNECKQVLTNEDPEHEKEKKKRMEVDLFFFFANKSCVRLCLKRFYFTSK